VLSIALHARISINYTKKIEEGRDCYYDATCIPLTVNPQSVSTWCSCDQQHAQQQMQPGSGHTGHDNDRSHTVNKQTVVMSASN
jgi:hypothetical protein